MSAWSYECGIHGNGSCDPFCPECEETDDDSRVAAARKQVETETAMLKADVALQRHRANRADDRVETLERQALADATEIRDLREKASDAKQVAATARGEMAIVTAARDEYQKLARAMNYERDTWADTARALRTQESRISGTLMDSGITFEALPEGVAALVAERDELKAKLETSRVAFEDQAEELRMRIAQLDAVRSGVENVWMWQGQGDEPHSLLCPVVMTADTLREMVAERDSLAKLVECAIVYKIGSATITKWGSHWHLHGPVCEVHPTLDTAIARAREIAKGET